MKKTYCLLVPACLILFIVLSLSPFLSDSADCAEKNTIGEAFSDPSKKFPMPDNWIKKPVTHEKENEGADLFIVMDQDIYYTLLPMILKFGKDNNMKIVVKEGTCGIASGMLIKKTADMGGFCCPAGHEDRMPGLRFHTMGIVAKAFFVHPDNPVGGMSSSQLRDLYKGKIYRWSEFRTPEGKPGPGTTIKSVARLHCQKRPGHWRRLLNEDKDFSPRLIEVSAIPDMISQVARTKDAIGWEVLTMLEKNKNMGKVKPLKIDGHSPNDSKALAALKYPFYRTYTLTTWDGNSTASQKARKLVNYMIKEFEKLDADKYGFVSVSRLKKAGWKFEGDELVGEPVKRP